MSNYIPGLDVTKYQHININKNTGEVTASDVWYGKVMKYLGYQTHVDKSMIVKLAKILEKEGNELRKTPPSERKYELLGTSRNIIQALNTLKFHAIKSDIIDDTELLKFRGVVEEKASIAKIYQKADEGAKSAYDFILKRVISNGISKNEPLIIKTEKQIKNLSNNIRKLNVLRLIKSNSDIRQKTLLNFDINEKKLLTKINGQINALSTDNTSPFQQGYIGKDIRRTLKALNSLTSLGSVEEFKTRLEIFRDTGEFPTRKLSALEIAKPSEKLKCNGQTLKDFLIEFQNNNFYLNDIKMDSIDEFIQNLAYLQFMKEQKTSQISQEITKDTVTHDIDSFIEKMSNSYDLFKDSNRDEVIPDVTKAKEEIFSLKERLEAFRDRGTFS